MNILNRSTTKSVFTEFKCPFQLYFLCFILIHVYNSPPLLFAGWCPSLNLPNGKLTYNSTPAFGKYPEYTVASLRCIYGYRRSGPSSKQCLQYDYWHDQKPTECNKSELHNRGFRFQPYSGISM